MNSNLSIIKLDYLQRTRGYGFLITLCASLAIAYTFVPEPNANYATIRISNYVGLYNSAWLGYVTAIMTSIFLSFIGFYLVSGSLKNDLESKVGQIVAATPISNFKYLLSKVLSNFLVLLTIVVAVFLMAILLFVLYNDGYSFNLEQFVKPYLVITIPAIFFISVLAVILEVLLYRKSVIQNLCFFILFSALITYAPNYELSYLFDVFGNKLVIHEMEETVRMLFKEDRTTNFNLTIGYVTGNLSNTQKFVFNGVDFPSHFMLSRFIWPFLAIGILILISPFFHRFNLLEKLSLKKESPLIEINKIDKNIELGSLPKVQFNYNIYLLLKTELILLFRKDNKWLWIINVIGMGLLAFLPSTIAHQIVLPILWFLQVSRLSDITTKEVANRVNYVAYSSFRPIKRLLTSQLIAAAILILALSMPLIIRYAIALNFNMVISIVLGAIFIVMLAAVFGIFSKGRKLFEVFFFMLSYGNINGIVFLDYFGGFSHQQYYVLLLTAINIALLISCFLKRNLQLSI